MTRHQRRERSGPRTTLGRVVGVPESHQQCTQVGVAEAELAELEAVLPDLLRRVVGPADEDLLSREHHLDGVLVGVDIERAVLVEVLEQVDRGQVARRVVDVHVLRAWVRPVDAVGVGRRVPPVDRGVELQTGIGALPGGLGDLAPQVAGADRLDDLTRGDAGEAPVGIVDDRLHELIGDAHRVVGVLVLDRERVGAVEVHVEAGIAQHTGLALFLHLAPDELLDIRVVGVQDDHLGGTSGLATRLDRAGRCVGAPHEAHRARCGAAALEQLGAGADLGQVDARTRTALEDHALLAVPVEDGVHRVVDRQDEAGAGLLTDARHADVEPHRAVESGALRDEDVLQFVGEGEGLGLVGEVAALVAPARDRVDDTIDHLPQRRLALGGPEGAAEVLLGDDVGGVHRPGDGELDAELFEGDGAVLPVRDAGIATLPDDFVIGVDAGRGEESADADGAVGRCDLGDVLGCQ